MFGFSSYGLSNLPCWRTCPRGHGFHKQDTGYVQRGPRGHILCQRSHKILTIGPINQVTKLCKHR